jgi:DNA helicase-2/ATP-dependent DNA helicase PcrA
MAFTYEQNLIIDHEVGHALVGACPGSGKTTTMVALALKLLEKGVSPKDILILTFGSESQKDFAKRLVEQGSLLGLSSASLPDALTFHSLGNRILSAFVAKGFAPAAALETSNKKTEMMAMNVLKETIGQREFKEVSGKSQTIIEDFMKFVDFIKSGFLSPSEVFNLLGLNPEFKFFIKAFDNFEDMRKKKKIRFFSDLLYDPVNLMLRREDLRKWIGGKKKYIIVDEYQDTNTIQHELVKIIAGDAAYVSAVGDIDQSIFEWRGGSPNLMLHQFKKDFPNPKRFTLSRTFRYGHLLSLLANSVVTRNDDREDTMCVSGRADRETAVDIVGYRDGGQAALEVIQAEIAKGRELKDIAVLVRLYSAAAPVELELLRAGINYKLQGGYSCLYSREMKNLEFILQLAMGQHIFLDKEELKTAYAELLKFPHVGVKNDTVDQFASRLASIDEKENPGTALSRLRGLEEKPYVRKKIVERAEVIEQIIQMGKRNLSAKQILDCYIRNTELYKSIQQMAMSSMEYSERRERCEVFVRYVEGLGKDVLSVLDAFQELREKQFSMSKDDDGIIITSIHKAKGLEWPVVLMPGLESSRFPYEAKNDTLTTLESERRLFFVGMTRAIMQLYLLAPDHPELRKEIENGSGNPKNFYGDRSEPSSFIFEMRHVEARAFNVNLETKLKPKSWVSPLFERYWNEVSLDASQPEIAPKQIKPPETGFSI